ncbi:MAG: phage portal protein [Anaerolineae bacterium]|nr:phage portal protein [Anaerolineae bacterium]
MPDWIDRLLGKGQRRALRPQTPHIAAVAQHNAWAWPALSTYERQAAVYEHNAWVYVAVNRIAEAAALVPLHVTRRVGERHIPQVAHPAERLLAAPNPFLSGFELIEQTIGALELTGNAYWFLAGDAQGRPAEIWLLRPDRVAIVPDEQEHVRGYVYTIDGQQIPLAAVEVIHFRRWHPRSDYYGLSALQAARVAVQTDDAMARWNRDTFGADRAVPAGLVNVTEFVSDSDFERLKREWRESYGGAERRTAFLRGGAVQWQGIGLNQQDVDFLNGRRFNREEIFHIYGIPPGMWSENATEANARTAERVFIERTLWPKLVRLAGKITAELLPFWGAELEAAFEDIRPTDVSVRLAEIRTAYPVLSINEVRARYYDLPPVAWGEAPVSGSGARPGPEEGALAVSVEDNEALDTGSPEATPAIRAAGGVGASHDSPASPDAIRQELARWERWAIRRVGKAVEHGFVVEAVPDDLAVEISARLLLAEDAAAIRAVFRDAGKSSDVAGEADAA